MSLPDLYLDLDGTILDVAPRYHHVHRATVHALGAESRLSLGAFWAHKRAGWTNARILEHEGLASRIDPKEYAARFLAAIESDEAQALDMLLPGARGALDALGRTHALVIVTLRREHESLARSLVRLGIAGLFDAVLSGSPLGAAGEETKAALVRARGLAIAGGSWLVGDTEIDVRAGKALGLRTCAVTSGIRDEALLGGEAPERLLSDLAKFAVSLGEGT